MKKYAERSEAKKKYIKIKRGPKKLNFGASKPGVRGGPGPLGPPPGSASEYIFQKPKQLLDVTATRQNSNEKYRLTCRLQIHGFIQTLLHHHLRENPYK